jgi:hypothetical protein
VEQGRGTYRFLYSREKPPPCCMQLANQYDLGRVHFVEEKNLRQGLLAGAQDRRGTRIVKGK